MSTSCYRWYSQDVTRHLPNWERFSSFLCCLWKDQKKMFLPPFEMQLYFGINLHTSVCLVNLQKQSSERFSQLKVKKNTDAFVSHSYCFTEGIDSVTFALLTFWTGSLCSLVGSNDCCWVTVKDFSESWIISSIFFKHKCQRICWFQLLNCENGFFFNFVVSDSKHKGFKFKIHLPVVQKTF